MQFRDLRAQYHKYKQEIDAAIGEVLESTNFIGGRQIGELEAELAEYVGMKHCITCANGTEAMTLVLTAWGLVKAMLFLFPILLFSRPGRCRLFAGQLRFLSMLTGILLILIR